MLETNRKEQFLTKGTALKRCYRKEKRLMANLNTRQKKCLELLLNEKEFRSAKYLAEKLQVSDKTVLQDIKAIQEYLNPFHVTLIRKTGSGILLPEKARGNQELLNGLRSSAGEEGSVPAEFRRMEIIKRLLLMDESCLSIQKLSDEFYVSRASIVNDFKAIENWVADYGLTLVTSRKGRSLEGPEKGIRHAIAAWVRENNPSKNTEITPGEYMQSGEEETHFIHTGFFTEEEVELSGEVMRYLEQQCSHTITEPYYSYLRDHILICASRTRRGHFIEWDEHKFPKIQPVLLNFAKELLGIIRKHWEAAEQESFYLYRYLVSSDIVPGKQEYPRKSEQNCLEETDFAPVLVKELSHYMLKALRITVEPDSQLMEGLLAHVRPLLNRVKYDIRIQSRILEDMEANYGELLGLCQAALWCICRKYGRKEISIKEVSYIAIYYQAMLEAKRMEKKILVVTNSGFGATQLLETKLRQYFPTYHILDVVSMIQLEKLASMEPVDFIISTVPLKNMGIPCIQVSGVMSDTDIRNIQDTIAASWLETDFSLERLRKQYEEGNFALYTVEQVKDNFFRGTMPYQGKRLSWGHCLQVAIGINTDEKTYVYRRENETEVWHLVSYARTYDGLLEQLAESYQILCSSKGREMMERCYSTEDLKQLFL